MAHLNFGLLDLFLFSNHLRVRVFESPSVVVRDLGGPAIRYSISQPRVGVSFTIHLLGNQATDQDLISLPC